MLYFCHVNSSSNWKNVESNLNNLYRCINEVKKLFQKMEGDTLNLVYLNGFILLKSFLTTSYLINRFLKHPPAFQYTKYSRMFKKND